MNKQKIIKRIIIGILSSLFIGFIVTAAFSGYMTFLNSTQLSTNEETTIDKSISFFNNIDFDYTGFQNQYTINTCEITSTLDGHTIPADFIISNEKDADTIIMIHGLGGNRQSIFPVAEIFLEQGFNVLAYDQRSSGANTAQYTTFGYLESNDTADCVKYLDDFLSNDKDVYIWGVSNGAATAGIASRHDIVKNRVKAIILDCPISNTDDMMRINMQDMDIGIPVDFLMFCGNICNRIVLGFTYDQASSVLHLSKSKLPILTIATKSDEVTPYWMSEKIHEASSNSVLVYVEDSGHADIFFDYPDWYKDVIYNFIK